HNSTGRYPAKSAHKRFGIQFGHSPHVNNEIGRGIEQRAREVRELAVDMAHARGKVSFMLAAVIDGDLVAKRVEPPDRVRPSQCRASEDQYAHSWLATDQVYITPP